MEELSIELIQKARSNDQAFRQLYDHYSSFLWRVIYRTVHGNEQLAGEILQSVFILIHRNLKKFRNQSTFSTWLYQIAWRETIRILKKEKKGRERFTVLPESLSVSQTENEAKKELDTLLTHLDEEERFLLVSRELDGFSFEELAEITGKTNGSLRTAVTRIKQKMREVYHG